MTQRTQKTIERITSKLGSTPIVIFGIAFFAVMVPSLAKIVTLQSQSVSFYPGLKEWTIIVIAMLATTTGLISFFYVILTRGTRTTTELKRNVVQAYQKALDESSFNPHQSKKQHEQRTM